MTPTPEAIEAAHKIIAESADRTEDLSAEDVSRALAAADAAMEAAGSVRVPVEPTDFMIARGEVASEDLEANERVTLGHYEILGIYRAMIAARPTTPPAKA